MRIEIAVDPLPAMHPRLCILGFLCCHLLFEALNEALVSLPGVPRSVTAWSVTIQFGCCTALPFLLGKGVDESLLPKFASAGTKLERFQGWLMAWAPFGAISAMVFLSNGLSQYSTHHVEFTLKIVAKSSKLMPTMLIANLLGNAVQYGVQDYVAAVLLCTGTALFSYGGSRGGKADSSNFSLGLAALAMSCACDGLVPNAQQKVMRQGATTAQLMACTNIVGVVAGLASVLLSGEVAVVAAYATNEPRALAIMLCIGVTLAGSVFCYTEIVEHSGSVFAVGVATLRKTVSLFLSYLLFPGKSLGVVRACGLALAGLGIVLAERRAALRGKVQSENRDKAA